MSESRLIDRSIPARLLGALLAAALFSSCSSAPPSSAPAAVVDPTRRADLPEWAKPYYFKTVPFRPDQAIPNPPADGSEADLQDLKILHERESTRTSAQCALAHTQEIPTLENTFSRRPDARDLPDLSRLSPSAFGKLKAFFQHAQNDVAFISLLAKENWKRPRPFRRDSTLHPCIKLESSFAYPSGHAAFGEAGAEILAEVMPRYAPAFRKAGDRIGQSRITGGVHHPSDIAAGDELARKTIAALKELPEFRKDLEETRAAVQSALAPRSKHRR